MNEKRSARKRLAFAFLAFVVLVFLGSAWAQGKKADRRPVASLADALAKRLPVASLIHPARKGGDPARLIALTFDALRDEFPSCNPADLWANDTQEIYMLWQQKYGGRSKRSARQSWVSSSGRAFEELVVRMINKKLARRGILAVRFAKLPTAYDEIREKVLLRIVRPCSPDPVPVQPDCDVLLLSNSTAGPQPFCILSCKTSLHARLTESLFWAILIHQQLPLKVGFVTLDLDKEFGTCKNPTRQSRVLGETFFDRMYSLNKETVKCRQLRSFDGAYEDFLLWRKAVVREALDKPFPKEIAQDLCSDESPVPLNE